MARSTATAAWRGSTATATTATVSTDTDKPGTATVDTKNKFYLEYHLLLFQFDKTHEDDI